MWYYLRKDDDVPIRGLINMKLKCSRCGDVYGYGGYDVARSHGWKHDRGGKWYCPFCSEELGLGGRTTDPWWLVVIVFGLALAIIAMLFMVLSFISKG